MVRPSLPEGEFGPVKQIDAGVLNVGYVESGPAGGPADVLLHRWPYDIHSFAAVTPILADAGYRAVVPYVRGYGTTRFRWPDGMRNGQQSAAPLDVVALMDALGIERPSSAGSIGGRGRRTSWARSGRNGAARWCR